MGTQTTSGSVAAGTDGPGTDQVRVLLVDNQHDRRQLMRYVVGLGPDDRDVVGNAESPSTAVRAVTDLAVDAALVEIQMPLEAGLATVSALRDGFPGLRIVVCSFHREPATMESALARGADAYVVKPLSPAELALVLRPAVAVP
jgi:two-component system response regulator YesN